MSSNVKEQEGSEAAAERDGVERDCAIARPGDGRERGPRGVETERDIVCRLGKVMPRPRKDERQLGERADEADKQRLGAGSRSRRPGGNRELLRGLAHQHCRGECAIERCPLDRAGDGQQRKRGAGSERRELQYF